MTPAEPPKRLYGTPPEYRISDDIDDGILVVGEDSTVVWANPSLRRMLGDVPGTIPNLAEKLAATPGDRIPVFECRLLTPDGRERRCLCSGRKAPSGKDWVLRCRETPDEGKDYETIVEYTGMARSVMSLLDVTGRRRAEQALQESEERLNLALSAANDRLVDWNVGTGTIFYSPRASRCSATNRERSCPRSPRFSPSSIRRTATVWRRSSPIRLPGSTTAARWSSG